MVFAKKYGATNVQNINNYAYFEYLRTNEAPGGTLGTRSGSLNIFNGAFYVSYYNIQTSEINSTGLFHASPFNSICSQCVCELVDMLLTANNAVPNYVI